MTEIWNGTGEADGKVYFTKDNGVCVGRRYVRRRVSQYLSSQWNGLYSLKRRHSAIVRTIGSDDWCRQHNGETVTSVCRQTEDALLMDSPDVD